MAIKFTGRTLHERHEFLPGPVLAFEGTRVEEYFINAGWAEDAGTATPDRVYSADEVAVDVTATHGSGENVGKAVLTSNEEA